VQRWAEAAGADGGTVDRIRAMWGEPVSDDWYGRIFAHARPDQLCGEVTPEYSLLPPEGIEHVRRLNPRMKIIFLMRDPVERCWSHLRMLGQGRPDFDYLAAAQSPEVLARADYGRILRDWSVAFPPEQIVAAWPATVQGNAEDFLRRLCGFLALPEPSQFKCRANDKIFVGRSLPMPADVRELLRDMLGEAAIPPKELAFATCLNR
jgi:hypothetical protein